MRMGGKPQCGGSRRTDTMEMITVYVTGGLLYGLIELLWRGWTH